MGTVTIKGQITIPKTVRDHLGIGPGSQVRFRRAEDGSVVIEPTASERPGSRFERMRGHAGRGLTTDEIMTLTRGER
jgi:antitoxin PrlF